MNDESRSEVPAWWDTLTFSHGPETEWFARSVFRDACRAGKAIYWHCAPTARSIEELGRRLVEAGFRLVLEHRDRPAAPRAKEHLHRVYVRETGDAVAIVNRERAEVILSLASFDPALADRLTAQPASRTRRRAR